MTLRQLRKSDEKIEDIVNALLATNNNLSLTYNDGAGVLTVSLDDNIDIDSINTTSQLTDPSGTAHSGELADDGDTQPPESHGNSAHVNDFLIDGVASAANATIERFTSSGTYTKPSGTSYIIVHIVGGGGGGIDDGGPVGGGGGEAVRGVLEASEVSNSVNVSVGGGGSGSSFNNGSSGGASLFGNIKAQGGARGDANGAGAGGGFDGGSPNGGEGRFGGGGGGNGNDGGGSVHGGGGGSGSDVNSGGTSDFAGDGGDGLNAGNPPGGGGGPGADGARGEVVVISITE
jgi:hypothetical protein